MKLPSGWTTSFRVIDQTLVVHFDSARCVISSAVLGGGIVQANGIINHQLPIDSHTYSDTSSLSPKSMGEPSRYLRRLSNKLGIQGQCVGLMTAVDIRRLVVTREKSNNMWVEGFFTVGVSNAVRAGDPTFDALSQNIRSKTGTINIILVTNVKLSRAAMVNAVAVATESKAATLMDVGIRNASGTQVATGTGTDVVAVVSGVGPYCRYSGAHTKIGELIGQVVIAGVTQGLRKDRAWQKK